MQWLQVHWIVCHRIHDSTSHYSIERQLDIFVTTHFHIKSLSMLILCTQNLYKYISIKSYWDALWKNPFYHRCNSLTVRICQVRTDSVVHSLFPILLRLSNAWLRINWVHKFILIWKWVNKITKLANSIGVSMFHRAFSLVFRKWFGENRCWKTH